MNFKWDFCKKMEEEIDKQMKTEQTYHLQKLSDITICIIYL